MVLTLSFTFQSVTFASIDFSYKSSQKLVSFDSDFIQNPTSEPTVFSIDNTLFMSESFNYSVDSQAYVEMKKFKLITMYGLKRDLKLKATDYHLKA